MSCIDSDVVKKFLADAKSRRVDTIKLILLT